MNTRGCRTLAQQPLSSTWFRALELQFLRSPLGTKHTKANAGRFNPGERVPDPFAILYLCENQALTLQEVEAIYGTPDSGRIIPNPHRAWAVINIHVQLQSVVDLTEPSQQRILDTSLQELTGAWSWYNKNKLLAPTQKLGLDLFRVPGLEAFLSPSMKAPDQKNLNLFPAKLRKGSRILFHNPLVERTHILKGK